MSEQLSPSELEKAIEVIEQFENTMELDGITRIAFQKIKSAAKRVKELEAQLNEWKRICGNRDRTVNEQGKEWVKLKTQIDKHKHQLRAKDELIERLVSVLLLSRNSLEDCAKYFDCFDTTRAALLNDCKRITQALQLAHSQGYGKEKK